MTPRAGKDDQHLVHDVQRLVLTLLEDLDHPITTVELGLRRRVQVGPQLGERLQLAERGQIQAQTAGHFPHRLDLCRTPDARHRNTDVHRRADAGKEQVGL